jgi:hypothetical protein
VARQRKLKQQRWGLAQRQLESAWMADDAPGLVLTSSQIDQMVEFCEEHAKRKDVLVRDAPNLGSGYREVTVLDEDGKPTSAKRVLFPT